MGEGWAFALVGGGFAFSWLALFFVQGGTGDGCWVRCLVFVNLGVFGLCDCGCVVSFCCFGVSCGCSWFGCVVFVRSFVLV